MKTQANNDRDLKQIIIWGSALPAGVMLAALQSLQSDFTFKVSSGSGVALVAGVALVLGFWKIVFDNRPALWRAAASAVMIAVGIGAFLYPLRFISAARLTELFTGLASAVFALSIMAILMLKVRNFLDEDDRRQNLVPVVSARN